MPPKKKAAEPAAAEDEPVVQDSEESQRQSLVDAALARPQPDVQALDLEEQQRNVAMSAFGTLDAEGSGTIPRSSLYQCLKVCVWCSEMSATVQLAHSRGISVSLCWIGQETGMRLSDERFGRIIQDIPELQSIGETCVPSVSRWEC